MTKWDKFFREKVIGIFTECQSVIDVGGGLRILREQGNRYDKSRNWILPYVKKVKYKILDPVPNYNPDIIGDIHNLPLVDSSQEAIICLAVMEHAEDPKQAFKELHRVLKPGGVLFGLCALPFLLSRRKGILSGLLAV